MHHPRSGGTRREMMMLVCLFLLLQTMHVIAQPGFISIDCGLPSNQMYVDPTTNIKYVSDVGFIDTGINMNISSKYQRLSTLRSFPDGVRNCYTINAFVGSKYLLKATFMYGNYDGLNTQPYIFELHLGVNLWKKINISNPDGFYWTEVITVATTDFLSVCLVNIRSGTPFISGLDIRELHTTMYPIVDNSTSLVLGLRYNFGSADDRIYRYPDDPYDRIWSSFNKPAEWTNISTSSTVTNYNQDPFEAPTAIMSTAATPVNSSIMEFYLNYAPGAASENSFFVNFHFSELLPLPTDDSRIFNIYLNDNVWQANYTPKYLMSGYVYSIKPLDPSPKYKWELKATEDSTFPPLINALEVYTRMDFGQLPTDSGDVDAITAIKIEYQMKGNWMGDPCAPMEYSWDGLNCSYTPDPQRIISLNLSSRTLTGVVSPSFADLTALQYLDLSNNSLTGTIPDALGNLPSLKFLDLSCNNLVGQIPASVLTRLNDGLLQVRFESSDNGSVACANKALNFPSPSAASPFQTSSSGGHETKHIVIAVISAIVGTTIILAIVFVIWYKLCRGRKNPDDTNPGTNAKPTGAFSPSVVRQDIRLL